MKKLFVAASLLVASFAVNAQDGFTSKNGHQVLPEAGDYGLSFDAIPVLNFIGNAFNGAGGNTISANSANNPFTNGVITITGRKMLDANTAVRARIGLGLISQTQKTNVAAIPATTPTTYVEDKVTTKQSNFYLSAGLEKRRGSSRVQGIYGAELVIAVIADANKKYEYGNAISASNPVASRNTEEKNGNTLFVGPRGFVGAEYFIAPKISLGGEFGLGIYLQKTGASETTSEGWNGTGIDTTTTPSTTTGEAGNGYARISTDNFNASINLNFFF